MTYWQLASHCPVVVVTGQTLPQYDCHSQYFHSALPVPSLHHWNIHTSQTYRIFNAPILHGGYLATKVIINKTLSSDSPIHIVSWSGRFDDLCLGNLPMATKQWRQLTLDLMYTESMNMHNFMTYIHKFIHYLCDGDWQSFHTERVHCVYSVPWILTKQKRISYTCTANQHYR